MRDWRAVVLDEQRRARFHEWASTQPKQRVRRSGDEIYYLVLLIFTVLFYTGLCVLVVWAAFY
jgi:hypothetical protein